MNTNLLRMLGIVALTGLLAVRAGWAAEVVVAQGEKFKPLDEKGWKVTAQDDSYASHTYGGMWVCHGGLLGAPAEGAGSVATQTVNIPAAGQYRVWSKYQAPPYFNYMHRIEVVQNGKVVFSHDYGKVSAKRLWSFAGAYKMPPIAQCWWTWGVDHDAAEAPPQPVSLAAGPAELRLVTIENAKPAGDRMVDFVLLTTELGDTYNGYQPYGSGSPFALEAMAATELYMRFQNTTGNAAQLSVSRRGHFQPNYGGAETKVPAAPVGAGEWSQWHNIGPFCRLVHDEGLWLALPGAGKFKVQFARDAAGKDVVGDSEVQSGESVVVPIDVTWNPKARVLPSREHAVRLTAVARKEWRTANAGRKPEKILYYGAFAGQEQWLLDLKDVLGYNTQLPDKYQHVACDGYFAHIADPAGIAAFAAKLPDKSKFRVLSFGDEIGIGDINFGDPAMQDRFVAWLKANKVTKQDLGVEPEQAKLADRANPHIAWYGQQFSEQMQFAHFKDLTAVAKREIGPQVLTGANYSPHGMPQYYGPIYQWVDIFKYGGMTMFWTEDYIFSVPQPPQFISWMFATMRCAVKYNNQPMHMYVMPHAPGQIPEFLRRNMVLSVGYGARHIDSFWVAPEEAFTENYIAWGCVDSFRVVRESIYDSGEAEQFQADGKVRPARVAIVLSKATDYNERRLLVSKANDPFLRQCENADASVQQVICRVDQQLIYLALRHAQHAVDLITEDDIVDGGLKNYEVVYFAGEWIDHRAVPVLADWVRQGGVLYATAGLGRLNEFGEDEPAMAKLLGLKGSTLAKNVAVIRPYLELPLLDPIDTITMDGRKVGAIGMRQELAPDGAKVLATWANGKPAVTVNELGKGKAFAVGTLAGTTYLKTGVRVTPWARGGRKMVYNPTGFDEAATRLVLLGVDARKPVQDVVCSNNFVEAVVIDHPKGTLLTLVNWDNKPLAGLQVKVRLAAAPQTLRSVQQQRALKFVHEGGMLTFNTDLEWADYFLMPK